MRKKFWFKSLNNSVLIGQQGVGSIMILKRTLMKETSCVWICLAKIRSVVFDLMNIVPNILFVIL